MSVEKKQEVITIHRMDTGSGEIKNVLAEKLAEARERTRRLLCTVSDEDLAAQHDPIMSPLIWDYGHIGNYEELWLLERAFGKSLSERELYEVYDASLTPRSERPSLAVLDRVSADRYLDAVREAALEALENADLGGEVALLKGGFVYHMIVQHEYQHNETMLQTLQLMKGEGYRPEALVELPPGDPAEEEMVRVPGGPFVMGTDDRTRALDNERPAHEVEVAGFYLDKTPVTNRAYIEFVEDGGYEKKELWDHEGWVWIKKNAPPRPSTGISPSRTAGGRSASASTSPYLWTRWSCTSRGTRPTRTPGGPASASRRRRSGRRQPLGTRRQAPRGSIRGATSRPAEPGRTWTSWFSGRRASGRIRRVRAPTVL